MTDEVDPSGPEVDRSRRETTDPDLVHEDTERELPDGPDRNEATDDLPGATDENEPPIERHDGQVYGG